MNTGPFTTPEIAAIAGVPVRKIISYTERGYVQPSVQDAAGHGSKRLWSYEDAIRCYTISSMAAFLSVRGARQLGEWMASDTDVSEGTTWDLFPMEGGDWLRFVNMEKGRSHDPSDLPPEDFDKHWAWRVEVSFSEMHHNVRIRIAALTPK